MRGEKLTRAFRNSLELTTKESSYALRASLSRICGEPVGPRQFREKSGAYEKSLEVREILHMGVPVGKTGRDVRRRPAINLTIVASKILVHTSI